MENFILKIVNLQLVQPYKLLTLLKATYPTLLSMNETCCDFRFFLDDIAAGNVYIGNSDVTTTNFGSKIIPGQITPPFPQNWNVIPLGDIHLLPAIAGTLVSVQILFR